MTIDDDDLRKRAFTAYVSQDLAGSARAIVEFVDLAVEQTREIDLTDLLPDFENIRSSATALNHLLSDLIENGAEGRESAEGGLGARIRHDLRTPLNAIIGYSEMIAEELADTPHEALKSDVAVVTAEAARLLLRIDQIVDASLSGGAGAGQAADIATGLASTVTHALPRLNTGAGLILVIDDVDSNRELLSRRLEREGHKVLLASSGAEGLALLAEHAVDVVLLDVLMPDMNGIEVLSAIKANAGWERIPVIMISGLTEMEAVIRCISAGADDYLSKPINTVLLKARLNAGLERKRWADQEQRYLHRIEAEKDRADALLHSILPGQVVTRLNDGEAVIADRFDSVTILFADLVGFTPVAAKTSPVALVRRLDQIFGVFDELVVEYGVEKIKTIGDAYLAASGIPEPVEDHAERITSLGQAMLRALPEADPGSPSFELRIGIHTGPVVAGLLGRHRFVYDVWGETVNIASRLEAFGIPGHIQLSEATRRNLSIDRPLQSRGQIALKGVGAVEAFIVSG
ncbi:response regulator [Rhodobacteraceae bacterium NNCM2]|nr:response regulator [Coraliihabitans acroporae]